MNYGYYLYKEDRSDLNRVGQTLLSYGAECFLFDIDNLHSELPKWETILSFLKNGDKLIVTKLNDICLPLNGLLELFEIFKGEGIQFLSIKENFSFNQNNHDFYSVYAIYDDYYKNYYGTFTKKKLKLAKINNQVSKDRSKKKQEATPKAMEIADKYLKGKPVEEIKNEHNVCHSTFKGYLQHVGINPSRKRNGILPGFEDDEPVKRNIVEMYLNENSIAQINRNYPTLNSARIRKVLVENNVEIRVGGKGRRKPKTEINEEIAYDIDMAIIMYLNGELVPIIVNKCNFPSRSKLLQILKERNVKIRSIGWSRAKNKNKPINVKKAIKMYQNGNLVPEIIKKCNFSSRNQLLSILKEHNVQIRPVGWSKTNSKIKFIDIDKAIKMYKDGELVPTIVKECNYPSRSKLLQTLKTLNIEMRPVGWYRANSKKVLMNINKAIAMYQNGDFVPTILKECYISNRNKLLDILKEEGVEIRGIGRPRIRA